MRKFGFKAFSSDLRTSPSFIKECADFISARNDAFFELMVLTDENAGITMETGDKPFPHNDLWIKDFEYLKSLQK